jgi:Glutamine synthetase, catalytic domain
VFLADFQDLLPAFFLDMARALRTIGSPLEKFTIESPHGMPELNVRYDDARPSADKHARFKLAFRAVARQHGYLGSFTPKPFEDMPGAGCQRLRTRQPFGYGPHCPASQAAGRTQRRTTGAAQSGWHGQLIPARSRHHRLNKLTAGPTRGFRASGTISGLVRRSSASSRFRCAPSLSLATVGSKVDLAGALSYLSPAEIQAALRYAAEG